MTDLKVGPTADVGPTGDVGPTDDVGSTGGAGPTRAVRSDEQVQAATSVGCHSERADALTLDPKRSSDEADG
jgi:hypothetical protein